MSNTFETVRRNAVQVLKTANIDSAEVDVRILLMHAGGFERADLITRAYDPIPADVLTRFKGFVRRRKVHEPIAHITGMKAFWSLDFKVSDQVLVPRPETEGVVSRALEMLSNVKNPRILDVGTGSGAILLSLLRERSDVSGDGVDISDAALSIAKENAVRFGVAERCQFYKSDFLGSAKGTYDIIVSNPPYITNIAMDGLAETVKGYEPDLALRGGIDGLDPYRSILEGARSVLKPSGGVVFEIGYDQGESLGAMLKAAGFGKILVEQDLAGHDRVVSAEICGFL